MSQRSSSGRFVRIGRSSGDSQLPRRSIGRVSPPRVRMAARRPNGSFAPGSSPTAMIDLTNDGDDDDDDEPIDLDADDEPPGRELIDLSTPSPPPQQPRQPRVSSGNIPLREKEAEKPPGLFPVPPKEPPPKFEPATSTPKAAVKASTVISSKASSSVAPPVKASQSFERSVTASHSRRSSPGCAPSASAAAPAIQDAPGSRIKASPQSTSRHPRTKTPEYMGRRVPYGVINGSSRVSSSDNEEEDDEIEDIIPTQNEPASLGTPSKSSSGHYQSPHKSLASPSNSAIASTSPLLTRLQEKKRRTQVRKEASPVRRSQSPPGEDVVMRSESRTSSQPLNLEEPLRIFLESMKDDHACSVRYILANTRATAQQAKLAFMENSSPFTSLNSVRIEANQEVLEGAAKEGLNHYLFQKGSKLNKSKSSFVAKKIYQDTPRVPKYSSHTNVRRNILEADDEKLKFIPFLGDAGGSSRKEKNFKRLVKELEDAYEDAPRNADASREGEEASRIRSYLDLWLEELNIGSDMESLQHYLLLRDEDNVELGLAPRNRTAILKTFKPLSEEAKEAAARFCDAFDEIFDVALQDVILPAGILKEMVEGARKKPNSSPPNRIATYTDLTCVICAAIDCPTHGDYAHEFVNPADSSDDEEESERKRENPEMRYEPHPLTLNFEDSLRRHKNRKPEEPDFEPEPRTKEFKPCSENCYLTLDYSQLDYEFSDETLAHLPQLLLTYKDPIHRACVIAFSLDIPCWAVYSKIQRGEGLEVFDDEEDVPMGRPKKPEWYDNNRKVLRGDFQEMTTAHLHQERAQAVACGHPGPCISRPGDDKHSCPCASSNILCENFCGCSDDCPRRFTGCSCLAYGLPCVSDSCICVQMNRECGPKCRSCGASERIDPAKKYDDDLFRTGCQNVYLQRGVSKAMVMGESQLVGFGLYLAEAVKKGDFLSEYAGENISSEEAERRGIVYDRKFLSFLFDLNRDRVIDAARLGNKTRFINHAGSSADGLNCEAKIVLVNGEHRIKFIALRDIDVGEELLFNYGKKFAEKQGLDKTLPKAKAGGKRGVLVGEEALDALDGMDQRKRGTREKIDAIRGGKAGDRRVRGGKMRKTAPARQVEAPVEENLYAQQPEEDEDEDEDILTRQRLKRNSRRPLRYTR